VAEEIELKLTASAAALTAVCAHPAVTAAKRGRMRTQQIVSTYFDTPGRDLASAGVALRLRRAGTRWLQTVKGEGDAAAGVHRRTEFEWRLPEPKLDIAKLARTPWRKLFARSNGHYRRVFATAVRRSELPLAFADGTRATLCLDVGEIRAGRRRVPLTEVEVELKHGDPSRLFELAEALTADLPLRISHASKAERGYALARAIAPEPRRARTIELAEDATPQAALAMIGSECTAQIEANAEAMATHDDPEYLHQLRVGWRRLRSLLKLAALVVPAESIAPLEEELRWLGSILGPARDYDVFALETLPRIAGEFRGDRALARLRARVTRRRRESLRAVRGALASVRLQHVLLALGAFFASLGRMPAAASVPAHARDWIGPVLQARHDKLARRLRHIHRLGAPERHRARVAAKKLRYAAEFFASLYPDKHVQPYVASVSKVQSVLGRLNDFEVARKLLDVVGSGTHPGADAAHASGIVRGWLAASVAPELKRLRDAVRAFRKCEPFWSV
jgi:inorganic triphosphatase YgiF